MHGFSQSKCWRLSTCLMLVMLSVAGCGSSSGKVSGKVTYRGAPLPGGTVQFMTPDTKFAESAAIGPDGTYTFARVPVGPVKIVVQSAGNVAPPPMMGGKMAPPPGTNLPPEAGQSGIYNSQGGGKQVKIPDQYADPETSGLTYTVTRGAQTHDIDLK